jgi:hypothetical protein
MPHHILACPRLAPRVGKAEEGERGTIRLRSGSSAFWVSDLHGMDSHSISTRRASLISATTGQMGLTTPRAVTPARWRRLQIGVGPTGIKPSGTSTPI